MPQPTFQSDTFTTNPSTQRAIQALVNSLADLCSAIAAEKGFRDDEIAVAAALHASAVGGQLPAQALAWLASTALQAEIARAHSELSEALEGARKPHADAHCPGHDNLVVELADALIRILDIAGRRQLPIGEALVAKLLANCARPYKHGKNS